MKRKTYVTPTPPEIIEKVKSELLGLGCIVVLLEIAFVAAVIAYIWTLDLRWLAVQGVIAALGAAQIVGARMLARQKVELLRSRLGLDNTRRIK